MCVQRLDFRRSHRRQRVQCSVAGQLAVDRRLQARSYVRADANWNITSLAADGYGVSSPVFNTVERYDYDPYGSVTYLSGSFGALERSGFGQRYLHQGGRLDEVTGLYSFRFREYDPVQGRWKQASALPAGERNTYARSTPASRPSRRREIPASGTISGINGLNGSPSNYLSGYANLRPWLNSSLNGLGVAGDPKSRLDAEASSMADDFKSGQLCSGGNPKTIRILMIAPKTGTRPNPDPCCCKVRIDILYDPYDKVPNQEPLQQAEGQDYWNDFAIGGGNVVPVDLPGRLSHDRLAGPDDPISIYMPGPRPPRNDKRPDAPVGMNWIPSGTTTSVNDWINAANADMPDHKFICHSQGCNILMNVLNQICRKG